MKCLICKKPLIKNQEKYCSKHCSGIGHSEQIRQVAFSRRTKTLCKCKTCDKNFTMWISHIARGAGKYCSYKCYWKSLIGKGQSAQTKKLHSQKTKAIWANKEYKEKKLSKILKGLFNRPTLLEQQMMGIIKNHQLPYKYTGNGDFWIGGKNPDFVNINGEKKLIEVGCEYWKKRSDGSVENYIKNRSEHFLKYGWKSYIFIQDKLDESAILREISS